MFTIALSVVSTIVVNVNVNAVHPKEVQGLSKKLFLFWLPRMLRMNPSPNIVKQDAMQSNNKKIGDTIIVHLNQSGRVDGSVDFTFSLQSDKLVIQQWKFIAAVVDRMCLMFSIVFTFISVIVFLVYAF